MVLNLEENLTDLKVEINTDAHTIPPFIKGTTDKFIYDSMYAIITVIKDMCKDYFLTKTEIEEYISDIHFYEKRICDNTTKTMRCKIFRYVSKLVDKYLIMAEDMQLYESEKSLRAIKNEYCF